MTELEFQNVCLVSVTTTETLYCRKLYSCSFIDFTRNLYSHLLLMMFFRILETYFPCTSSAPGGQQQSKVVLPPANQRSKLNIYFPIYQNTSEKGFTVQLSAHNTASKASSEKLQTFLRHFSPDELQQIAFDVITRSILF